MVVAISRRIVSTGKLKLAFHDADTDTDTDILVDILVRILAYWT